MNPSRMIRDYPYTVALWGAAVAAAAVTHALITLLSR